MACYADSLWELSEAIYQDASILKIGSLTSRYDTEDNSRLRYEESEFVSPQVRGKRMKEVPIHFCPNYKIGVYETSMPGVSLHIRMYLVQDEYLAARYITEYELAVLNAAMNAAITVPGSFGAFERIPEKFRHKYVQHRNCYSKFESRSGKEQKLQYLSSCTNVFPGPTGAVFLRLVNEAIACIADTPSGWGLDWSDEIWHGLYGQGNLVPSLLQKAARNILRRSAFVAEAVGVKDTWDDKLQHHNVSYRDRAYIDTFATANQANCLHKLREFFPAVAHENNIFYLYDIGLNMYPSSYGHSLTLDGRQATKICEEMMECSANESKAYSDQLFRNSELSHIDERE